MSGEVHSGSAVRPCLYFAPGHVARPIRHWRRMPSVERNVIEALAADGPDTLIIVIGRTCDLVNFPDVAVERRMLRYSTHAAASILERFDEDGFRTDFYQRGPEIECGVERGGIIRYPLIEPYRYQPCSELVPDPNNPEAALELPRLEGADDLW